MVFRPGNGAPKEPVIPPGQGFLIWVFAVVWHDKHVTPHTMQLVDPVQVLLFVSVKPNQDKERHLIGLDTGVGDTLEPLIDQLLCSLAPLVPCEMDLLLLA